ncbi:tigger transposable element-derived protein 1-like [Macrobrachium rosenbergii]|uniref:tigger transposable element-derived protein 1-like n=1 Tax=Macrobrachium rosenbergii TaxID=79674 RepID=UPI0034D77248
MMPGFKAYKDRLTLLLGGNVAGYKLKPLMVYHSENPRALKRIDKHTLPVHYCHNKNAWMTAMLFEDWFVRCFIPEVKDYCRENKIPFKILLILDNAPGHPQNIGDINENVKVVFLPPNTISLIQPMDQGAVATFKAYYLRNTFAQAVQATDNEEKDLRTFWKEFNVLNSIMNIGKAWKEVKKECMNGVWKNLLQVYVNSFKGFNKDKEVVEINKKIVTLGRSLDLETDEEDIQDLLDVQDVELMAEDLIALAEERKRADEEEEIEEEPERKFTTKALAEVFASFEHGLKLLSEMDGNMERFAKVKRAHQDAVACYQVIYEERKKRTMQPTMEHFFKRTTPVALPSASPTPTRTPTPTFEPRSPSSLNFETPELTEEEILSEEERVDDPEALSSSSSSDF